MICEVDGCTSPLYVQLRGYCRLHYQRWYHGRSLIKPKGESEKTVERVCLSCDRRGSWKNEHCGTCRDLYRRYGTSMAPPTKPSQEERFWDKVDKSGDCWLWVGASGSGGRSKYYGYMHSTESKKKIRVHRYSYELHKGVTLQSYEPVHHICANTLCVKPSHLQVTTPAENTAEMLERNYYLAQMGKLATMEEEIAELRLQIKKEKTPRVKNFKQ